MASLALLQAGPALAQTGSSDTAELVKLLKAQAEEIAALRARLDKIEGSKTLADASRRAPQAPVPPAATGKRSDVANDDTVAYSFAPQLAAADLADHRLPSPRHAEPGQCHHGMARRIADLPFE